MGRDMESIFLGMMVGVLGGIGFAVSCVAQELKHANQLKTTELKAAGIEV